MQSVYGTYDMPYAPLVPQHLIVNSPQAGNNFQQAGRFPSQQDYHQYMDEYSQINNEYEDEYTQGLKLQQAANFQQQQQQQLAAAAAIAAHNGHYTFPNDQPNGQSLQNLNPESLNSQDEIYSDFQISGSQGQLSNFGIDNYDFQHHQQQHQHQHQQHQQHQQHHQHLQHQQQQQHLHEQQQQLRTPLSQPIQQTHASTLQGSALPGGIDFSSAPSRTVYLGNIPVDITPKELLDNVRSGIVENVRILPDKMCAFISFLDESSALLFHSDAILKRLTIQRNDIKIGWGRNVPISPAVVASIQIDGATRNVYIGNLPKNITEEKLIEDLKDFGVIDTVKILHDSGVAFIHFCSILSATKVVNSLAETNEFYADKKIFYGKDRCAFITKTQQHNAAQYLGLAPGMEHLVTNADREFISSTLLQQSAAAAAIATTAGGANNLGNRTVYLGNLPKDVRIEEICNVVRGGLLQNVKYLHDRHVCFVTFIDPIAAAQFFAMSQLHGLTIHNKRIKIGWGKHSGPLSNALTLAVSSGASRNIYIGNIDLNDEKFSKEYLRRKFSEYGDIEQINYLEEKNCVFINFTNISNAILAIDKIKVDEDLKDLKINFGKDRCGNIPRQFVNKNNHNLKSLKSAEQDN